MENIALVTEKIPFLSGSRTDKAHTYIQMFARILESSPDFYVFSCVKVVLDFVQYYLHIWTVTVQTFVKISLQFRLHLHLKNISIEITFPREFYRLTRLVVWWRQTAD